MQIKIADLVRKANARLDSLRRAGLEGSEAYKSAKAAIDRIYKDINFAGGKPTKFVTPRKSWENLGIDVKKIETKLSVSLSNFLAAKTSTVKGERERRRKTQETFRKKYNIKRELTPKEFQSALDLFSALRAYQSEIMLSSNEEMAGVVAAVDDSPQAGEQLLNDITYIKERLEVLEKKHDIDLKRYYPAMVRKVLNNSVQGMRKDPDEIMRTYIEGFAKQAEAQYKQFTGLNEIRKIDFDLSKGIYYGDVD